MMAVFNLLTVLTATSQTNSPVFWSIMGFGFIGSAIGIFAFLPQSLNTIKTKKTNGVSIYTFIIYTTANSMWFIWGIMHLAYSFHLGEADTVVILKDLIIIVTNIPCALWAGIILGIKINNMYKYGEDCKKWKGKANQTQFNIEPNLEQ